MANTQIKAQDLLDQLLKAGRELAKQGQTQTKGLSAKGKKIATQGENYLVDKLGLEDSKVSRESLRKGVGAGAAAGALALLLSSRSGRKIVTLGGLAGLGTLAWKSYQKNGGTMPKSAQDIIGRLKGPKAEIRSESLLRAMIAAAKADGTIGDDELSLINAHNSGGADALKIALSAPESPKTIAALADSRQAAREIYAVSCRVASGLSQKERDYLDELAMALDFDPEIAARLETDIRTG